MTDATFYGRVAGCKHNIISGQKEEEKIKDSHWVFCTEKYKKGIRSAEGSSRITPVLVEPESHINRPVKTRAIGEQLCILSFEL